MTWDELCDKFETMGLELSCYEVENNGNDGFSFDIIDDCYTVFTSSTDFGTFDGMTRYINKNWEWILKCILDYYDKRGKVEQGI